MSLADSAELPACVRAAVLRDCAYRLKIVYSLPRRLDLDDLKELAFGEIEVNEFSRHVQGAQDHFKFQISEYSMVNGSVGGNTLVVTYGKLGAQAGPKDRDWVERFIAATYAPIAIC